MIKRKLRIPKSYIFVEGPSNTKATRDKTGKLTGRVKVKGRGDGTRIRRVEKGPWAGIILGRTPIRVKGTSKARGYMRVASKL